MNQVDISNHSAALPQHHAKQLFDYLPPSERNFEQHVLSCQDRIMQMSFACAVFNMVFCPVSARGFKKEHCKAVSKQYKQAKKEGKV